MDDQDGVLSRYFIQAIYSKDSKIIELLWMIKMVDYQDNSYKQYTVRIVRL